MNLRLGIEHNPQLYRLAEKAKLIQCVSFKHLALNLKWCRLSLMFWENRNNLLRRSPLNIHPKNLKCWGLSKKKNCLRQKITRQCFAILLRLNGKIRVKWVSKGQSLFKWVHDQGEFLRPGDFKRTCSPRYSRPTK